jgi:hypothetical protein
VELAGGSDGFVGPVAVRSELAGWLLPKVARSSASRFQSKRPSGVVATGEDPDAGTTVVVGLAVFFVLLPVDELFRTAYHFAFHRFPSSVTLPGSDCDPRFVPARRTVYTQWLPGTLGVVSVTRLDESLHVPPAFDSGVVMVKCPFLFKTRGKTLGDVFVSQ